jgi:ABC-type transport system involved in cytochrome bd biosynthesis fused ATPase/permease subunit
MNWAAQQALFNQMAAYMSVNSTEGVIKQNNFCLLICNRTRILVTHQLDVLPKADLILVMDRDNNNEGHIFNQMAAYMSVNSTEGVIKQNNFCLLICCSGNANSLFLAPR